jgi:hypothetical protein
VQSRRAKRAPDPTCLLIPPCTALAQLRSAAKNGDQLESFDADRAATFLI